MRTTGSPRRGANRPMLIGAAAGGIFCLAVLGGTVASQGRSQPGVATARALVAVATQPMFTPTLAPGSGAWSPVGPATPESGSAPPPPAPDPTLTSQPPLTAAELAYVNWADLSSVAMDVSAGLVMGLMDSPRLDDQGWRQGMMAELAAWKRIGRDAGVQSAPPTLHRTHTQFLAGMDRFATAAALVTKAIESSQPSFLVPAAAEMQEGLRQIGQVEAGLAALLRKRGLKA